MSTRNALQNNAYFISNVTIFNSKQIKISVVLMTLDELLLTFGKYNESLHKYYVLISDFIQLSEFIIQTIIVNKLVTALSPHSSFINK